MKKILCIIFSCLFIITLICSIPFTISAASLPDNNYENSSVIDDIKAMYMNYESEFPYNAEDKGVYLINFIENGYDQMAGLNSELYGLYVYVYNPSGKELFGEMNKIQMATKWGTDGNGELKATDFRVCFI